MCTSQWYSLGVSPQELRCSVTLTNGQCFGWRAHPTEALWTGVIDHYVISLKETGDDTLFTVHSPQSISVETVVQRLREYFYLDRIRLADVYTQWEAVPQFKVLSSTFGGVRLIRQDPVECLFSFICSSANNIPRITSMLRTLRERYGRQLATLPTSNEFGVAGSYHAFPTVAELVAIPISELQGCAFGYRAKFVVNSAIKVVSRGGLPWLLSLRDTSLSTDAVQKTLQDLNGVGPKVAACVALFSLDRLELVPVDTHVYQIALRDYKVELPASVLSSTSITSRTYKEVADFFRGKFGEYAGWAQSVMFVAELPAFKVDRKRKR